MTEFECDEWTEIVRQVRYKDGKHFVCYTKTDSGQEREQISCTIACARCRELRKLARAKMKEVWG